jgi:hypothetical protein
MTYKRKPYMTAWRNKRLAAGDTQRSVWFTPQALAHLLAAKGTRSVEATIADALAREAGRAEVIEEIKRHDEAQK